MAKKTYTIRLYRTHDHDLVTFIETHQFNLVRAVYSALTAFSKGEVFVISIPPERIDGNLVLNRVYSRLLTLDTNKDADAIAVMDKLKDGSKNNFLKNLLRLYLCNPMSEQFLKDTGDTDFFYQKFEIFRKGKKEVHAGKLTKIKDKTALPKQIQTTANYTTQNKKKPPTAEKDNTIKNDFVPTQPLGVIEEPDYETAVNDINSIGDQQESDEITDMFSTLV